MLRSENAELNSAHSENDRLKKQLNDLTSSMNVDGELRDQFDSANRKLREQEGLIHQLESDLNVAGSESHRLKGENDRLKAADTTSNLSAKLKKQTDQNITLRRQQKERDASHARLQSELDQCRSELRERGENCVSQKDLDEAKERERAALSNVDKLKKEIARLKSQTGNSGKAESWTKKLGLPALAAFVGSFLGVPWMDKLF